MAAANAWALMLSEKLCASLSAEAAGAEQPRSRIAARRRENRLFMCGLLSFRSQTFVEVMSDLCYK
jgi:hypothetical protein